MTLPNWDALPVRTKRSRKRLYTLIASELSLTAWKSLPNNVKRSNIHLYNYIASAKNLEEYDELAKNNMRSTRLLYNYIKENASGSKPTLTVKVKDGENNVSGATVTIGTTEKTTDASGETTYSLDYDNYTIEVEATGFEDYSENIKFRANHKTFTIPLEATLCKVTVTAKDGSANKLEDAVVTLSLDATEVASGTTDKDGVCVLEDIRFGTYTLAAVSDDETLAYTGSLTVDDDETATITLTAAATGTVTVTCTDGITPIVGATVTLKQDSQTVKTGTSGEGGVCVLEDVPYGTYTLEASGDFLEYSGSLTVDGDETETIILETPL